jgi:hypothetical protein
MDFFIAYRLGEARRASGWPAGAESAAREVNAAAPAAATAVLSAARRDIKPVLPSPGLWLEEMGGPGLGTEFERSALRMQYLILHEARNSTRIEKLKRPAEAFCWFSKGADSFMLTP